MSSKVNPKVPIQLDKKRHLLFNLNAMVAFQEATGKNLFSRQVAESLAQEMNPADLRAMLWACLLHEDSELTLEQVGSWINPNNMTEIATTLIEAWETASPESEGETDDAPLPANSPG